MDREFHPVRRTQQKRKRRTATWNEYERRKAALKDRLLFGEITYEQYDLAIQRLTDELGL
ncbi:MAG: hypothetical protein GVY18_04575 [Bacteroidetes bacterium]|jgi:uncharacterized membrane protein|nr:hypothetical protein [Bacteroidota bacterium]